MRIIIAAALSALAASAASPPFTTRTGSALPNAVFHRLERVVCTRANWSVSDASGKKIASGLAGSALPTYRYGAFRVASPSGPTVSYAVIPDVPPARSANDPFGMGGYFSMRYSPEDQRRAASLLRRMGAASSRDELNWDLVEPEPGHWTWDKCDAGVAIQHEFGIEPLGLLCYWGKFVKDRTDRTNPLLAHSPAAVTAYADYCRECVARYKPGGALAKQRGWKDAWGIRHWEIWNEPATFWTGTPEQFGTLLKAAYSAIKAGDQKAVVHFSNIAEDWDARALKVAGNSYDGLTPHYYCPPRSPDEAEMDRQMRETVKWYTARGLTKNLWVSEVGWDTTSDIEQEARQAQDLVRAHAMALDAGMSRVFWYNFRNDGGEGPGGKIPWFGVVNRDMTPKVSYAAYAAMVARLRGLKPAGHANIGAAVKAILFDGKSGSTAVVWADKQHGSIPPIAGCRLFDLMGNAMTGRIPLNDWPVYVEAPGKPAAWLRARIQQSPVAGIAPVEVKPFQILQRENGEFLVVNVRNQSASRAQVELTTDSMQRAAPQQTKMLRVRHWLKPTAALRNRLKPVNPQSDSSDFEAGRRRLQSVRRDAAVFRSAAKVTQITLAPGEAKRVRLPYPPKDPVLKFTVETAAKRIQKETPLKAVPNTVIPMGDREAPILDQLWALKPEWLMNTADHNVGILPWSPKDLSAKAQFLYDENGLWMRFIVTDDVFHQTRTGNDIWQEDSVQVSIQANASQSASAKRHSFGFALTPDGPKAFSYSGPGGLTGTIDVTQRGKQTTYDVRIPWPDLAPLQGKPGEHFLMDFMVNDNDGYGRRGWLEWTGGIGTGDDPSKWMEWTLGKPGPPATRV